MKKTFVQGIITILLFFGTWFTLSQINWVKTLNIRQVTNKTEQKLGDLYWSVFKNTEKDNNNPYVVLSIDSIVTHLCKANQIDRNYIQVHVFNNDEINAFALPNGHLIICKGLILDSDNQEELTGVISHEIAHIELNHVMKKLITEVGLSVLVSITTGSGGSEIIKETAKVLSSTAFDRKLEKEADIKAVDYMLNAQVNPKPFADFLYKLSDSNSEHPDYLQWIRSHPESKERAEYILEYSNSKETEYKHILSDDTWSKLKEKLTE